MSREKGITDIFVIYLWLLGFGIKRLIDFLQ